MLALRISNQKTGRSLQTDPTLRPFCCPSESDICRHKKGRISQCALTNGVLRSGDIFYCSLQRVEDLISTKAFMMDGRDSNPRIEMSKYASRLCECSCWNAGLARELRSSSRQG